MQKSNSLHQKTARARIATGHRWFRCKVFYIMLTKQNYLLLNNLYYFQLSFRFICEVITDFVLGQKADTFSSKPTPVLLNAKNYSEQSFISIIYMALVGLAPPLKKYKKLRFVPKPVEKYFMDLIRTTFETRRKSSANRNRTDFLNYLLQLQEKKRLKERELTAHAMTILLDGFTAASDVLAHCLLMVYMIGSWGCHFIIWNYIFMFFFVSVGPRYNKAKNSTYRNKC